MNETKLEIDTDNSRTVSGNHAYSEVSSEAKAGASPRINEATTDRSGEVSAGNGMQQGYMDHIGAAGIIGVW